MLCVLGAKVSCLIIIIKLLQVSGQADAKGGAFITSHKNWRREMVQCQIVSEAFYGLHDQKSVNFVS